MTVQKIGFGGGCHWCTEAVFQSLRGVINAEQGYINSKPPHDSFSEAALVEFDSNLIPLKVLIDVHLRTHASTSDHSMRRKYRSAIYVSSYESMDEAQTALVELQCDFPCKLVTKILRCVSFEPSPEKFRDYYQTNTNRPFCKTYIDPKLAKIRQQFSVYYKGVNPCTNRGA